jgi:preprotein translocase subunit SecF
MARDSLATRLYRGEVSYDFIGHRRRWYTASSIVMLIGIVSLVIRGLNPSIDFTGGAQFQGPLNHHSVTQVGDAVRSAGVTPEVVESTGSGSDARFQVQTVTLTNEQVNKVEASLVESLGVQADSLSITTVGSTWGGQITRKAVLGLVIFLIAVIAYLSVRFEWKMALAAIIALIHDLIITAGIYSLSGLQVSPSTVIALLTILGYSLYDTVVVFDKVRENTQNLTATAKSTYSEAANLAVNQTLVRSINTSVVALLPIASILVIGTILVGAGTLEDLALALFIGIATGTYSSIFIATPLLADLRERQPEMRALRSRVLKRRAAQAAGGGASRGAATGDLAVAEGTDSAAEGARTATVTVARPGPATPARTSGTRNQPKRSKKKPSGPSGKRR